MTVTAEKRFYPRATRHTTHTGNGRRVIRFPARSDAHHNAYTPADLPRDGWWGPGDMCIVEVPRSAVMHRSHARAVHEFARWWGWSLSRGHPGNPVREGHDWLCWVVVWENTNNQRAPVFAEAYPLLVRYSWLREYAFDPAAGIGRADLPPLPAWANDTNT